MFETYSPKDPGTCNPDKEKEMDPSAPNNHIIVFPFMAQGHTIPLVDLSKILSHRGLRITIITTPANSSSILQTLSRNPKTLHSIHLKELHFPHIDSLPKGCENTDQLPSLDLFIPFLLATTKLQQPFEQFLRELTSSCDKPNFIISDFFLGWTLDSASKFEIPRLVFHGMGVFAICVLHSLYTHMPHAHVNSTTQPFLVPQMPKAFYLTKTDLFPPFQDFKPDDPLFQYLKEQRESDWRSWGVIVNSFMDLDHGYMECLESFYKNGARAWCVGPVSLCNKLENERLERGRVVMENKVSAWLDEHGMHCSLIYVSFGTQAQVCDAQLNEISYGLEDSGVGFVWVMRSNSWYFPDGFEERVKGRGLIIRGWAPQLLVLSHRAIGGFLTHCGWNSVIESLSLGVPILAWPMIGEQAINAKFVVEELQAGLRVHGGLVMDKIVSREMVSQGVRELMGGEIGKKVRERARDLGEAAKKATEEGGSSHNTLTTLIDQLCPPKVC